MDQYNGLLIELGHFIINAPCIKICQEKLLFDNLVKYYVCDNKYVNSLEKLKTF